MHLLDDDLREMEALLSTTGDQPMRTLVSAMLGSPGMFHSLDNWRLVCKISDGVDMMALLSRCIDVIQYMPYIVCQCHTVDKTLVYGMNTDRRCLRTRTDAVIHTVGRCIENLVPTVDLEACVVLYSLVHMFGEWVVATQNQVCLAERINHDYFLQSPIRIQRSAETLRLVVVPRNSLVINDVTYVYTQEDAVQYTRALSDTMGRSQDTLEIMAEHLGQAMPIEDWVFLGARQTSFYMLKNRLAATSNLRLVNASNSCWKMVIHKPINPSACASPSFAPCRWTQLCAAVLDSR